MTLKVYLPILSLCVCVFLLQKHFKTVTKILLNLALFWNTMEIEANETGFEYSTNVNVLLYLYCCLLIDCNKYFSLYITAVTPTTISLKSARIELSVAQEFRVVTMKQAFCASVALLFK